MSLVQHELLTLPEHLSSPPVFSGVRVTRSLYVCFVCRCLSFCNFSFNHCVVCSSSIYRFWLPLRYLQTFLEPHGGLATTLSELNPWHIVCVFVVTTYIFNTTYKTVINSKQYTYSLNQEDVYYLNLLHRYVIHSVQFLWWFFC